MRFLLLFVFAISAVLTTLVMKEAKQLVRFEDTLGVQTENPTYKEASQSAILYFSQPSTTYSNLNTPVQTEIMINTGNTEVSEIQIELKYNTNTLSYLNITVPDPTFLGNRENFSIVFNEVDPSLGRASLAVKVKPNGFPKKGVGTVATLSFIPTSTSTSMISFTPASSVMSPQSPSSVLEKTYSTTFTYRPIQATNSGQFNFQPVN